MYRESWGLFFSICLLGAVFIGIVCASMTRLRAVPEPFIAIVFGLLIGAAVNIFAIDPGALRNMQVCSRRSRPFFPAPRPTSQPHAFYSPAPFSFIFCP